MKILEIEKCMINQIDMFEQLEKENNLRILREFQDACFKKDLEIRNSQWRKDNNWIVHENNVKRTLVTKFGAFYISRTKYKNSVTGKYRFLVDAFLEIEKYKRIAIAFENEILNSFGSGESLMSVYKRYMNSGLTRRTYSNILKRKNLKTCKEKVMIPEKKITNDLKYIYIDVDDCWTTVRHQGKKKEMRIRMAVVHQGKIIENGVTKLINKKAFFKNFLKGTFCNTEEYSKWLIEMINKNYSDVENKRIIVCGDGATWIKEITAFLGGDFVLDKFHFFKKVYQCFSYKFLTTLKGWKIKEMYEKAINFYKTNKFEELIAFLLSCLDYDKVKNQKIKALISYIKNNWKGLKNHFADFYVGCSAESAVSHIVKSVKGYGAKIYSKHNFEILLMLKIATINKIELINLIYHDFQDNLIMRIDQFSKYDRNKKVSYNNLLSSDLKEIRIPALEQPTNLLNSIIRKMNG